MADKTLAEMLWEYNQANLPQTQTPFATPPGSLLQESLGAVGTTADRFMDVLNPSVREGVSAAANAALPPEALENLRNFAQTQTPAAVPATPDQPTTPEYPPSYSDVDPITGMPYHVDTVEAKAQMRARNRLRKRQIQEQQTGEPQPGPSYEEMVEQERELVTQQMQTAIDRQKKSRELQGMTVFDVLAGGAPPTVGGEFVMPPGDMTKSKRYQEAKAAADAAAGKAAVEAMPDDETLGGTNPEDTPPAEETQQDPDVEYADVERPGDLRRAAAQRKLSQLTALRDIAEGFGRVGSIPVQGDFSGTGPPRQALRRPYQAEGLREAIADIRGDEELYLKSQLRREELGAEYGLKEQLEKRLSALNAIGIDGHMLTERQQDQLLKRRKEWLDGATEKKAADALAAVRAGLKSLEEGPQGEEPPGQAQVLAARQVLQAYGEGSRMSDQDIKQILNDPIFGGLRDEIYRFFTGKTTPKTVKIYKDMLKRLGIATRNFINTRRKAEAKSFSYSTGIPESVYLKAIGGMMEQSGGGGTVAAPPGKKVLITKDGKVKRILEADLGAWEAKKWTLTSG